MYCSHCGVQASGNFCFSCGQPLQGDLPVDEVRLTPVVPARRNIDWAQTVDYEALLQTPAVRELIAGHAARSKQRMSGEQFLEISEKVLAPVMCGLPLSTIGTVCNQVYTKLGVKMSRALSRRFAQPPGRVLVGVLCSLAEHGHEMRGATQAQDGCVLQASIPSDLLSFAGELVVTVRREPQGTSVDAAATIKGQYFDWGKSRRCLERLMGDVAALPAAA